MDEVLEAAYAKADALLDKVQTGVWTKEDGQEFDRLAEILAEDPHPTRFAQLVAKMETMDIRRQDV